MATAEMLPVRISPTPGIRFGVGSRTTASKSAVTLSEHIQVPMHLGPFEFSSGSTQYTVRLDAPRQAVDKVQLRLEMHMPFRERLRYLLMGASSITKLVPASGVIRGPQELALTAEQNYHRLMDSAERRIRD